MRKHAMSSQKASQVKKDGHKKEVEFTYLIGLDDAYQNDRKAKKDVIDFNGDAHSIKSGKWWQIFLYSQNRIKNDYGFLAMNGMGQLILDCLNAFPNTFTEYCENKKVFKTKLQIPMVALKEKLQDVNRLKAFLSKSIFNSGEVQYLTIYNKFDNAFHCFYYTDVVDILSNNFIVANSVALNDNQMPNQKVLFKLNKNIGEIEVRNDSEIHYKEIKFRLNGELTTQLLFYKTNNKIELFNRVFVYDNAIKHFKIKNKKGNK